MTPTISVVLPTYNRADRLRTLLTGLRDRLESEDVEWIVVDDGSTDDTRRLLDGTEGVRALHQANAGPAAARNAGLAAAAGEFVAFIDDDCTPAADWPLGLLLAFDQSDVGGVGGPIVPSGESALDSFVQVERLVDHGRDVEDGVDYLITANAMFRRAVLRDVGGFDEGFRAPAGEDVDLSWRVRDAGWRLTRGTAQVVHDHRTPVGEIMRTYTKHGRARVLLDQRHPGRALGGGSAVRAVAPSLFVERWRTYHERGHSAITAASLTCLRVAGLGAYWWGMQRAVRSSRERAPASA